MQHCGHWLLPQVITLTRSWSKDLINGWLRKVNLLKAHCTLCLGSQITHISEGQHTGHCVGVCQRNTHARMHTHCYAHKHTHYCSQGSA